VRCIHSTRMKIAANSMMPWLRAIPRVLASMHRKLIRCVPKEEHWLAALLEPLIRLDLIGLLSGRVILFLNGANSPVICLLSSLKGC